MSSSNNVELALNKLAWTVPNSTVRDLNTVAVHIVAGKDLTDCSCIGEGGFARVYRATHPEFGIVAYKKFEYRLREKDNSKIMREAEIHNMLRHPNIVQFYGMVFESGDSEYQGNYGLVLEYITNGPMDDFLNGNCIDLNQKIRLIYDVASAMKYLHEQSPPIIHGDLKIRNVLISSNLRAKVFDFGLSALRIFSQSHSQNNVISGTITHIPPEYWGDSKLRKTETFDIYGFGIFMWEAFSERRPFDGVKNVMLISIWVQNGERPDWNTLPDGCSNESIELMKSCWNQDSVLRPSFKNIVEVIEHEVNSSVEGFEREVNSSVKAFESEVNSSNQGMTSLVHFPFSRHVQGVAMLENKLYVIGYGDNHVSVFSVEGLSRRLENETIEIPGMLNPTDICVCGAINSSLVIVDEARNRLLKIQLPGKGKSEFPIKGKPRTISSSSGDESLLALVERISRWYLNIYNVSYMNTFDKISIPVELKGPKHVVQSSNGNFIVVYGKENMDTESENFDRLIGEMSREGIMLREFVLPPMSDESLWEHCHLAVDKYDNIIVSDFDSGGVILVYNQMTRSRFFQTFKEDQQDKPMRLFYDTNTEKLIVGQWSEIGGSISIFNLPPDAFLF